MPIYQRDKAVFDCHYPKIGISYASIPPNNRPKYQKDLNQIQDAERAGIYTGEDTEAKAEQYEHWLAVITDDGWLISTTAAQRSEAFVLTMEES